MAKRGGMWFILIVIIILVLCSGIVLKFFTDAWGKGTTQVEQSTNFLLRKVGAQETPYYTVHIDPQKSGKGYIAFTVKDSNGTYVQDFSEDSGYTVKEEGQPPNKAVRVNKFDSAFVLFLVDVSNDTNTRDAFNTYITAINQSRSALQNKTTIPIKFMIQGMHSSTTTGVVENYNHLFELLNRQNLEEQLNDVSSTTDNLDPSTPLLLAATSSGFPTAGNPYKAIIILSDSSSTAPALYDATKNALIALENQHISTYVFSYETFCNQQHYFYNSTYSTLCSSDITSLYNALLSAASRITLRFTSKISSDITVPHNVTVKVEKPVLGQGLFAGSGSAEVVYVSS